MKKFIVSRTPTCKTVVRGKMQTKSIESCPGTKGDDGGREAILAIFAVLSDPNVTLQDKLQARSKLDVLLGLTKD